MRFLEVGSGGFLGIGETTFLLPVEAVTKVDEDSVRVNQRRDRVAGAPKYDPDLVERTYLADSTSTTGIAPPTWTADTCIRGIRTSEHRPPGPSRPPTYTHPCPTAPSTVIIHSYNGLRRGTS